MGFHGSKFTWNKGSLFERLDRALCNGFWESFAPSTMVYHLYKLKFDHRPLAINFGLNRFTKHVHPFRYFSGLLTLEGFERLVQDNWQHAEMFEGNVVHFVNAAKKWNFDVFGNIFQKKRVLILRLRGIQRRLEMYSSQKLVDLEKELRAKLEDVLDNEELLWKQNSRIDWLLLRDRNTSYFYHSASKMRSQNLIKSLKLSNGL